MTGHAICPGGPAAPMAVPFERSAAARARRPRRACRGHRRGSTLIWILVCLVTLTAFCSLAVDLGRVNLARAELRLAVDSAARQAAHGLAQSGPAAARANAASAVADNRAGGHAMALDPGMDIALGTWDATTKRFTRAAAGAESTATAVQITGQLTAARGRAVPLAFARMVGKATVDLTVTAVARVNARKPGIIGLDFITMAGNSGLGTRTNSYRSKDGAFGSGTTQYNRGHIASNGDINLSGNAYVSGNATPGPGRTVSVTGGASVTGSTTAAAKSMSFPVEPVGTAATTNSNANVPPANLEADRDFYLASGTLTLAGGVYYWNNVEVKGSAVLRFSGPATVYISGTTNLAGDVQTAGNTPSNLRLVGSTSGEVISMTSTSMLYADVYCPGNAFKMSGSATFCGSVVARSVEVTGNAHVLFDESLTVTLPLVSLVQ